MSYNISYSTLTICRTTLLYRLKDFNTCIRSLEEHHDKVPSWMIDRRNNLMDAIDELEKLY